MRVIFVFCGLLMLCACSSASRERTAAGACIAEINNRLSGKTFEVDADQLADSAKALESDTWQIQAPIVFDRGFAGEYTQMLDCRVRFEGNSPNVIFLQFSWSIEDLKKAGQPGP